LATEKEPSSSPQKPSMLHGLLGILFSVSAFVVWLWSRKGSIEQHDSQDAALPQDTTSNTTERCQNLSSSPLRVVIDSAPPTPTPNKERETREDEKNRRDKKRFVAEVTVAFLLFVYTTFAGWQGCEMRKAATAAKKQTETAVRQLEMIDRPWLKLQGIAINDPGFTFSPDGAAHLSVRPILKNIGHSVATNVTFNAKMVIPAPSNFPVIAEQEQKNLCEPINNAPVAVHRGYAVASGETVIFPDDVEQSWSYGLDLKKDEVEKGQEIVQISGKQKGILAPLLVGCIDYLYPSSSIHHQTGFAYDIRRLNRQTGTPQFPSLGIIVGSNVASSDVMLLKSFFSGFYAY